MSAKDKRFFVCFIIGCMLCIVAVKVIFLKGTNNTSAVEGIIEEYTKIYNVSIFNHKTENTQKVCAFKYTNENNDEINGIAILKNNNRGSYDIEDIDYYTTGNEFVKSFAVINQTQCAIIVTNDKSSAVLAKINITDNSGSVSVLNSKLNQNDINFIAYPAESSASQKTITLYDSNNNIVFTEEY